MALKDWKKIPNKIIAPTEIYRWQKKNNPWYVIGIYKHGTTISKNLTYSVSGDYHNNMKSKVFKTKSKALAYAKAYMRKH